MKRWPVLTLFILPRHEYIPASLSFASFSVSPCFGSNDQLRVELLGEISFWSQQRNVLCYSELGDLLAYLMLYFGRHSFDEQCVVWQCCVTNVCRREKFVEKFWVIKRIRKNDRDGDVGMSRFAGDCKKSSFSNNENFEVVLKTSLASLLFISIDKNEIFFIIYLKWEKPTVKFKCFPLAPYCY